MKRHELNLTAIVKKEGDQYSALCLELDVAGSGSTPDRAIANLQGVIETYVQYMLEEGREQEIPRPVPIDALREFLTGEEKPRKTARPTFRAVPLQYSYAA